MKEELASAALRCPRPLEKGDSIGVTAPSSGVGPAFQARLDVAIHGLEKRGFDVVVGGCMDGASHVSAPARERSEELMGMLLDPGIRAVVPPWGGETGIDLLPLLDFGALARVEPTWLVGYSDISTLLTPITLLSGWLTVHGGSLMDTPYHVPDPLLSWIDVVTTARGTTLRQASPGVHRSHDRDDWTTDPAAAVHRWTGTGHWIRLDRLPGGIDVTGRLIGGCIEVLASLAGTHYGDTVRLRDEHMPSTIVYVEAAEADAYAICRALHGMRLSGFFDGAAAVLVGRTNAPDASTLTQHEAVLDALAPLGVPILGDVECGHVPPMMPIVNGALGRVVADGEKQFLAQTLPR